MENLPSAPSPQARYLPFYMSLAFLGSLAIGLITGFLARPLIIPDRVEVVEVVATAALSTGGVIPQGDSDRNVASTETDSSGSSASSSNGPSEADADDAPPRPTIMDFLMADARHIQGADDAPVTIIEFSDFK